MKNTAKSGYSQRKKMVDKPNPQKKQQKPYMDYNGRPAAKGGRPTKKLR